MLFEGEMTRYLIRVGGLQLIVKRLSKDEDCFNVGSCVNITLGGTQGTVTGVSRSPKRMNHSDKLTKTVCRGGCVPLTALLTVRNFQEKVSIRHICRLYHLC